MQQIFTTILLAVFSTTLLAQSSSPPKWAGSKIGITLGGDIEMPHGLDYGYLLSTAENPDFDAAGLPFSEGELTDMECDNPTFRFSVNLQPIGAPSTEWQFSLLKIDGRIDKVRYELEEDDPLGWQYLEVSATNKETAVEVVFLKKSQTRSLNFYGGLGTNIGYSHGGKVNVKGYLRDEAISDAPTAGREIDLTFDQKSGINQRLFLQAGMGVRFLKRMEAGFELRKGLGYRASFDGPFHFTILKRSIGLSLRYSFF